MPKAARLTDAGSGHECFPPSPVISGSPDVTINGLPAARVGDSLAPHACSCGEGHGTHSRTIAAGSSSVLINGKPAARTGDGISCGGVIISGSGDVIIGDTPFKSPVAECAKQAVINQLPLVMLSPALAATPVFAKSCMRGAGCTDAGTEEEPQGNFSSMSFYQAQPAKPAEPTPATDNEPVQRAQSAKKKKPASATDESTPPQKEKSLFDTVTGFLFGEAHAVPLVPLAPVIVGGAEAGMATAAGGATTKLNQDAAKALNHQLKHLSGPEAWPGQIAMNLPFVVMGAVVQSMLKGEKSDLLTAGKLLDVAEKMGSVPTRVRYNWVEDDDTGKLKPTGYHTEAGSGRDLVRVRLLNKRDDGRYEFWEDGRHTGPLILWTPADAPGIEPDGWDTGNDSEPVGLEPLPGLEYPDIDDVRIIATPIPDEKDFRDYILVFPENEYPPVYIYLSKPPVEFIEVKPYRDFNGRSRQGLYHVDHMPSRQAVILFLGREYPDLRDKQIKYIAERVAAIAIPANVHRQDSATYGGRNRSQTGPDSENLRAAIDKDFDQIKPVLMRDYGATEEALEAARKEMHRINTELGLYK